MQEGYSGRLNIELVLKTAEKVSNETNFTLDYCIDLCFNLLTTYNTPSSITVDEAASKVINQLNMGEHFLWNFIELTEEEYANQRREAQVKPDGRLALKRWEAGRAIEEDGERTPAYRLSTAKWVK